MTNAFNTILTIVFLSLFAACDKQSDPEKTYRINGSIAVDGRNRTFLLNLPPGYYESDTTLPLVIGLHGTGGSAAQFDHDYGFTTKANNNNFIIVYPEGVRSTGILGLRTWNAGTCCDFALEQQINDVKYIGALLDNLLSRYRINAKRVYITGMSNGGMFTYRLANEMGKRIAAVAAVSSTMVLPAAPLTPSRPMPILHIHSARDTKIPYLGGIGIGGYYFPPVDSTLRVWAQHNGYTSGPVTLRDDASYKLTEWSGGNTGSLIRCYLTQDGGHAWPGGLKPNRRGDDPSTVINATDLIWDFFKGYSLP
jgi:polyhydroxybutyrate depolymerase